MQPCPQCQKPVPPGVVICPSCGVLLPPAVARQRIDVGTTVDRGYGRFVIDGRLGEGGMGVVFRAWLFHPPGSPHEKEPRLTAVKVLRPQAQVRVELRHFFLVEAEALRKVLHPNIVRFSDLFEWNSSLALAMEYVDGDTVEDVIARHVARARLANGTLPGIPFRRAWNYWEQLLGALAATHEVGVVHRDVKPSNIIVRRDGIVKLTDYGIARLAPGEAPTIEKDLAPGTGAYMSPEQVTGDPIDARSDLYSAAIVLYEMLAARPPFSLQEMSEFAIRQKQVTTHPPPIRNFLPQAPPMLDALFARALAKDPRARFASAVEMGNAFRHGLGIPDTPEWRAQVDFAHEAAPFAIRPAPASVPAPAPVSRAEKGGTAAMPARKTGHARAIPAFTRPLPRTQEGAPGTPPDTEKSAGVRGPPKEIRPSLVPTPIVSIGAPSVPPPANEEAAHPTSVEYGGQRKMATLRDFLYQRYRTIGIDPK